MRKRKEKDIDELRRKLLKIGFWTPPVIISLSISNIIAEAQTPPGGGDLPAPPMRRKMFEYEMKKKRLKPLEEKLKLFEE